MFENLIKILPMISSPDEVLFGKLAMLFEISITETLLRQNGKVTVLKKSFKVSSISCFETNLPDADHVIAGKN